MYKTSLKSIGAGEKEGWMTKQGGSVKTWKRRWFVLKNSTLYYFKTKNADCEAQGQIDLESSSFVKSEEKHGKKRAFAVGTGKRIFFMYADTEGESQLWMKKINEMISRIKKHNDMSTSQASTEVSAPNMTQRQIIEPRNSSLENSPREKKIMDFTPSNLNQTVTPSIRDILISGRSQIDFLQDEKSKVLEFWSIWFRSIPLRSEIPAHGSIAFELSVSSDIEKLSWKASGPQSPLIQKMVDFFWHVGAPESEIDRLNEIGDKVNPPFIGSWIDMSRKDGMDGGWYFPCEIPIKHALSAADSGEPYRILLEWANANQITNCISVGRDMGAVPPRQTEIKIRLSDRLKFEEQLSIINSAYKEFNITPLSEEILELIGANRNSEPLQLSIVTSSEGFVRMGVLLADPADHLIDTLCSLSAASSSEPIFKLSSALQLQGPQFVEFQYLVRGFGYGVYREGFDVIFHFHLGSE